VVPTGMNPLVQQQRPALALANGYVYIGYGGNSGDCGQYNAWLVAAPENPNGPIIQWEVPTTVGGSIWGPGGPAVDNATGDVFVTTGNSNGTTKFDYGESVIKFSPTLQLLDYFAPSNWAFLNVNDEDLGSAGPVMLNDHTIFQIGKQGVGYILDSGDLGGIGGQEFSQSVCSPGTWGAVAYDAPYVYVPCLKAGVVALKLDLSSDDPSFSTAWQTPFGFFAGAPIVADGAVWSIAIVNLGRSGILYAFNPLTGSVMFQYPLGTVGHFVTPGADGDLIFTGSANSIQAFAVSPA
jgi:polyvinyl alcohol dehydrogenase (cytochrome)